MYLYPSGVFHNDQLSEPVSCNCSLAGVRHWRGWWEPQCLEFILSCWHRKSQRQTQPFILPARARNISRYYSQLLHWLQAEITPNKCLAREQLTSNDIEGGEMLDDCYAFIRLIEINRPPTWRPVPLQTVELAALWRITGLQSRGHISLLSCAHTQAAQC